MAFEQGTFKWFQHVVGLPGEGIVLRNTRPHRCGGVYLTKTLHESHATVQDCDVFFGGRNCHNGFKFQCHPNKSLRIYITDLFKRVHQVDDSPNHDVSRTFARGVFAEVKRDLKVNWAAFAVVTCHWGRRIFVPHPLWMNVDRAPTTTDLDQLLFACKKLVDESQVDIEMKRYLDFNNQKLSESLLSKGKELKVEDHSSLVLGKSVEGIFDRPVMNFNEAGPSQGQLDIGTSLPGTIHVQQSLGLESVDIDLATVKVDIAISITPQRMLRIMKRAQFLSRHGVPDVLLPIVMWKWRKVCVQLKSKYYVDHLVKENEENDKLEEAQQKKDLLLKEQQLMEEEKAAQKLQEEEFGSCVSKMVYVLLEDKLKGVVADTILKVTPGAQKRRVGKILGCQDVPTFSPPKKKRSPPVKSNIEEPVGSPARNTRSHSQGSQSILSKFSLGLGSKRDL